MNTAVVVGDSRRFELQYALMIYSEQGPGSYWGVHRNSPTYVTLHDVEHADAGPPRLGPGRPADLNFLRALTEGLQATVPPEILPAHVLCRTPDTIAWWSQARTRPMFFGENSELGDVDGETFPHPPLVWRITGQHMYVRALEEDSRPEADAPLFHAPYWNVNQSGRVCLGSMKRPGEVSAASLQGWEGGFFGSLFTGAIGGRGTDTPLTKLWPRLVDQERFPVNELVKADETLAEFVRGGGNA